MKRIALAIIALALTATTLGAQTARPENAPCKAPAPLKPGDRIALISPSYHTPMSNVDAASKILRKWGFRPVVGKNVGKVYKGNYAGTPSERMADLEWALKDTTIKAILCNRGGYGTIHLVNMLSPELFADNPKWIVGFSDITTIHGMATRAGVMSIHGTMCSLMAKSGGLDETSTLMRDILQGVTPEYDIPAHKENICGSATGTLVGGNLSTFSPVLGTWADATMQNDIILFVEEVEEDMSHIDRMINALLLNGVFDRCKGVVLGEFTDCKANLRYDSVEQLFCSYLNKYGIPVLCGFPGGHGDVNLPLIMGAQVRIDVTPDGGKLKFNLER